MAGDAPPRSRRPALTTALVSVEPSAPGPVTRSATRGDPEEDSSSSESGTQARPVVPSSESDESTADEPPAGAAPNSIPEYVEDFEVPRAYRSRQPTLFRPTEAGFADITGRRDTINASVLYTACAWLESLHNEQSDALRGSESPRTPEQGNQDLRELLAYNRQTLFQLREVCAARYDTIRAHNTHGAAYAQAVEEFICETPAEFKSSSANRVAGQLRRARLSHARRAQAASSWGTNSQPAPGHSSGSARRRGSGRRPTPGRQAARN